MVTAFAHAPKSAHRPGPWSRWVAVAVCAWLAGASAMAATSATTEEALAGPDVTIIADGERTIHEFRQNGELRMIRIVPRLGKPYYLVPRDPTTGFGDLERADMLLPSWVIVEF